MPLDVRKRSALPFSSPHIRAAPQYLGRAQNLTSDLPEGQRPSAHQAA